MLMFSVSNTVYSIHSKGLERDAAFLSRYVKELLFFYKRSTKGLPFMSKWIQNGKGLNLGAGFLYIIKKNRAATL